MFYSLYRDESSDAKINAQRNLCGRTHYVDDDTLRYFKCRIIRASVHDDGLLFSIVTSDAVDMNNTRRTFRYVIFDLFGRVLARPDLENGFRTSEQASQARYRELNKMDALAISEDAIKRERQQFDREIEHLQAQVAKINPLAHAS